MPATRVAMHKIREVLRLKYIADLSQRQIAGALSLSNGVVAKYLAAAASSGLAYPQLAALDDAALARALAGTEATAKAAPTPPDFAYIHEQLKQKGVTRQLLWEEYRAVHPTGYGYTQFTVLYAEWRRRLRPAMRQTHAAGEKLFLDYSGKTVPVVNDSTGEVREAEVFVAVLGASNYTYAEATWTQGLADWTAATVRALSFFGGVPRLLVPDNLKAAVTKACRYEPVINRAYSDLAAHYGCAVLPARPHKPRDKAKAEAGVQLVQRWILARLRHQTFFSLSELNRAIRALLDDLNTRAFKRLTGSRRSQFESLDRPALKPLPRQPYEYAEWKKARAGIDYHVEVERHFYSVPSALVRRQLDVRVTRSTVEVFHAGRRVASHPRSFARGSHTTQAEHMPKAHRAHMEWTPGRFLTWASRVGPNARDLVRHLLFKRPHPEMGYRSCLGLLQLARRFGEARLEAACRRALLLGAPARRSVLSILESGLDREPQAAEQGAPSAAAPAHENVRGAAYYR